MIRPVGRIVFINLTRVYRKMPWLIKLDCIESPQESYPHDRKFC